MKIKLISVLILILLFMSSITFAKTNAISVFEYQKMLGVGIDVNWCNFKKYEKLAYYWHKKGINLPLIFKKRGFDNVRIRVKGNVISNKWLLNLLRIEVNDCIKANIIPIIAYSADKFKKHPSEKTMEDVVNWWLEIAKIFKNYPYILSYDIIIEPGKKLKKRNDLLNELYKKVVEEIHKVDRDRIIFIAPNRLSNPYMLPRLEVPKDKYVMVEWHFFAAGPSKTNPRKKWTTGTHSEKENIIKAINFAYKWSKKHHIPTWVGAWMPSNYNKNRHQHKYTPMGCQTGGDYTIKEQIKFTSFLSRELEKRGIPYDINADNKFFNIRTLKWCRSKEKVLNTILNP